MISRYLHDINVEVGRLISEVVIRTLSGGVTFVSSKLSKRHAIISVLPDLGPAAINKCDFYEQMLLFALLRDHSVFELPPVSIL